MNNYHLSIIVPCFNEARNVTLLLEKLKTISESRTENIEIIVIDGGSTDNTPQELQALYENLPSNNFKLILNKARGGYGGDIMKALHSAKGEVLAWTHADLQTDPIDVFTAYDLYEKSSHNNEKVFIKGKRKNRQFLEAFFTWSMQVVVFFILKTYLSDINAQPKLFSKDFFNAYLTNDPPKDFSLDLFALYQAKHNGYKIITTPVYFKKRIHGEAKGGGGGWTMRLKLIQRTFKYIFKLKKNLT